MREALTEALHNLTPALAELRATAARGWTALQTPQELAPGLWLSARPEGLGLAPPLGQGRRLSTAVGIVLRPAITTTRPQITPPRPLPPPIAFRPAASGMRFDVALDLSLPALSDAVASRLAGQSFEVRDVPLTIEHASLSVAGDRLVLMADIDGEVPGRLDLRARPALDADTGAIRFADLDYVFDSDHPDAELILALFYERIRQRLQQLADEALTERLEAAKAGLAARLDRWLGDRGHADCSAIRLTALAVELGEERISLYGRARGQVRVVLE
jgi:hypothetical protein